MRTIENLFCSEERSKIESTLRQRKCIQGLIAPAYDDYSISNIPSTIFHILGHRLDSRPKVPIKKLLNFEAEVCKIVLLVVDSLGYNLMRQFMETEPDSALRSLPNEAGFVPLTSTFPSATTTALSTLNTGLTPKEHGMLGHVMYLREFATLLNMLELSPVQERGQGPSISRLELSDLLRLPTVHERFREVGLESNVVIRHDQAKGGLSKILYRGATIIPYAGFSDLVTSMRTMLEANPRKAQYLYAYWDNLDTICHLKGPQSQEAISELRSLFCSLRSEFIDCLSKDVAERTLLIIVGDHGQASVSKESMVVTRDHPRLFDHLLIPPTGELRASYLYPKPGEYNDVKEYVQRLSKFVIYDSQKALSSSLFGIGTPRPEASDRIGELIVTPFGNSGLKHTYPKEDGGIALNGAHGGLTEDEMLVPLIFTKLNA